MALQQLPTALLLLSSVLTVHSNITSCMVALDDLRSSGCLPETLVDAMNDTAVVDTMCETRCTAAIKKAGSACIDLQTRTARVALLLDFCEPCPKSWFGMINNCSTTVLDRNKACGECKKPICTMLAACTRAAPPAVLRILRARHMTETWYRRGLDQLMSSVASCSCSSTSDNKVAASNILDRVLLVPTKFGAAIAELLAQAVPDLWQ